MINKSTHLNDKDENKSNAEFISQSDMPENCPPKEAVSKDVSLVYRYIEGDYLKESDFLNHVQSGKKYRPGNKCSACGVSFFTTKKSLKKMAERYKGFKNKKFVTGSITSKCGVHVTKREHLNLWVFKDVDLFNSFTKEGEEE